jgi:hypothetical protein
MGRKQASLRVSDIAGIQEIPCSGRIHRVALLNDGQIAMLDHPRKLMRLEDEMLRKAKEQPCACVEHARAVQTAFAAGWSGSPRTEFLTAWKDSMTHREYSALFGNREGDILLKRKARKALKAASGDPTVKPFKHRVAGTADRAFRNVLTEMKCHSRETNVRAFHLSDPDCQAAMQNSPGWRETGVAGLCTATRRGNWALFFDVLRWYTKVYLPGFAIIDHVIVLKVTRWGADGRPTWIAGLKPTPKGQAAQVGLARVTPSGRVLFKGMV